MGKGTQYVYHGSKLPLLKQALKNLKKTRNNDTIIMFSDAYDVRIFKDVQTILKTFKEFDANVVFGAEYFFAPKPEILKMYPLIANGGTYDQYKSESQFLYALSNMFIPLL